MTIEAVFLSDQPEVANRLYKLVVPSDGFAGDFRQRVNAILQDEPPEVVASFDEALQKVSAQY